MALDKKVEKFFILKIGRDSPSHRLNMELDLQSLFKLHGLIGLDPASPPPPHLGS
jgi:hypothetical protein